MMKAIAIDDEPMALDILRTHAGKVPFITLETTFISATEALAYTRKELVDLVFLDISMPDLSGLEFAAIIKQRTQVIFTTAYPEHALKGFELAATDYLLKPVNFSRFLQACQLAENRYQLSNSETSEQEQRLFVKDGHNWIQIKLSNLLYAQGQDNYVSLADGTKQVLTRMTLAELQGKLPQNQFLRVHKSFIISIAKIEKVEKHQVTIGGIKIPLSRPYRSLLLQMLTK